MIVDTLGSVAGLVWLRVYMRVGSEDYGFVCLGIVGVGLVGNEVFAGGLGCAWNCLLLGETSAGIEPFL